MKVGRCWGLGQCLFANTDDAVFWRVIVGPVVGQLVLGAGSRKGKWARKIHFSSAKSQPTYWTHLSGKEGSGWHGKLFFGRLNLRCRPTILGSPRWMTGGKTGSRRYHDAEINVLCSGVSDLRQESSDSYRVSWQTGGLPALRGLFRSV